MIRAEKQRLRNELRAILSALPPASRASDSAKIRARLAAWPVWQNASSACAFCALSGEPDLLTPWPQEISLSLPRVEGRDLSMRRVSSPQELATGRFGILEPPAAAPEPPGGWDIILVPGVAFDRKGGRLGRGAGYYDRFLSRHNDALQVGVCFDGQLVPEVPCEPHDLRLDALITPSELLVFIPPRRPSFPARCF